MGFTPPLCPGRCWQHLIIQVISVIILSKGAGFSLEALFADFLRVENFQGRHNLTLQENKTYLILL